LYLKKTYNKKTDRTYLAAMHNYWIDGKSRARTVQSFGYVDELVNEFCDPITHFTEVVAQMDIKRKAEEAATIITIHPLRNLSNKVIYRKNFGFSVCSSIYHLLGIDTFLINRTRHKTIEFSLNAIMKLLVYNRILDPGSKKKAFESKDRYFENFDFSLDDIYRGLTLMDKYKDDLLVHINKRLVSLYRRNNELVYYDVTNYYFEIDREDDLRKKGICKEHRPNPIVQMGLLMDDNALPISFDIYAGNTNDCLTLIPTLEQNKERYGVKRIVAVADKGLNTSDNVFALCAKGDGYVFSQSVRKGNEELVKWVLSQTGYSALDKDKCRSKSRIATRILQITVQETDKQAGKKKKTKKVEITEKQICRYSDKYARRAKASRARAIDKARSYVAHPQKLEALIDKSAAKYLKGFIVNEESGEILNDTKQKLVFDEEKLAYEEALDGYYVICTSETDKTDAEIIKIYQGLWKIEESFKIIKSDLDARPVYVSRTDHIRAHFIVCYIALIIMRILQLKTANKHSCRALKDSLRQVMATQIEGSNWWKFDYCDEVLDTINSAFNINLTKMYRTTQEIRSLTGKTKKSEID